MIVYGFLVIQTLIGLTSGASLRSRVLTEENLNSKINTTLPTGLLNHFDNCPNSPTLHHGKPDEFLVQEYINHYKGFVQRWYPIYLQRDTLVETDLFSPTVTNAEFIFWGCSAGTFDLTLSNNEGHTVEGSHILDAFRTNWRFVAPQARNFDRIQQTTVLREPNQHYVAFFSIRFAEYQHLLLDHLGYLAYLRKVEPPSTKFILAETANSNGLQRKLLEDLDPEFAARVHWITCGSVDTPQSIEWEMSHCNQRIQLLGGSSLKVVIPKSSTKHEALLELAREWIWSKLPPIPNQPRTVVYYKRSANVPNGRIMDPQQETQMLQILEHMLVRFGRNEKIVVFDGSQTFKQQVQLFQSASLVIGPHGGGLANLLFSSMSTSSECNERTKVLEFSTSPITPRVQFGTLNRSYYNLFSTCPWLDYHHVWFTSESNEHTTYVDSIVVRNALLQLLGNIDSQESITLSK